MASAVAAPASAGFLDDLGWLDGERSGRAVVGADFALATNGTGGFLDTFDDGVLDPWLPLIGTPGPEVGGFLMLEGFEAALRPTGLLDGNVLVAAAFALADFTGGSAVGLFVTGESIEDVFALVLTPTVAAALDESGPLGGVPITAGSSAVFQMLILDSGLIIAGVNGTPVYVGASTLAAPVTSMGLFVIPEPGSAVALLVGGLLTLIRRR